MHDEMAITGQINLMMNLQLTYSRTRHARMTLLAR